VDRARLADIVNAMDGLEGFISPTLARDRMRPPGVPSRRARTTSRISREAASRTERRHNVATGECRSIPSRS